MAAEVAASSAGASPIRKLIPVTLSLPLIGATLGIDGGPIFQILAIENLELSPTAIGIAFGFGVVSLPVQLYAARVPLHRARRNAQLYLIIAALQAWILAALVAAGVTGPLASTALVVTVTAEVALSVLFATAWQPLLSWAVDTTQRQRLNATWPAAARGMLAGLVILFASLDGPGRGWFLAGVGMVALWCASGLRHVPDPPKLEEALVQDAEAKPDRVPLVRETRIILVVFGAVNIGLLPLWLVYLDTVLWPTANLGIVAGVQTAASMLALLAWRPTDGQVTPRAVIASLAVLVAVLLIPAVPAPITTAPAEVAILLITAVVGASATIVRVAMLEAAHRTITVANSVRAFTILDVVASTSLQAGLLVGGFLITASATSTWPIDPYLGFVILGSLAATTAVVLANRSQPSPEPADL